MKKLILILSGVGAALGFVFSYAIASGVLESWESLGAPPEKAIEIIGGDLRTVFVQTEKGTVYGCFLRREEDCWRESSWPQELFEASPDCEPSYWQLRSPPGEVIDKLELQYCGVEIGTEVTYALLEDGSIWSWRHGSIAYATLAFLCGGSVAGLLIGAFSGKLIAWRSSRKRNHN